MSAFRFDTRLWVAGVALALGGGVIAGGCGGPPPVDYTLQSTFCNQVAQADCSQGAVQACYASSDASLPTDTQTCINVRSSPDVCNPAMLPYHSAYAQPCVDAHTNVYMNAPMIDPGALAAMTQACEAVFNKGGPQGFMCTFDTDCDVGGGLACVIHQGKGTCQAPNVVNPGDACTNPADQCPSGFECDPGSHCVADPGKGGTCGAGIPCGANLRCDTTAMPNVCADQLPDTAACTQGSDCSGGFCIGGKCAASYTLAFGATTCGDFTPK